MRRSYLHLSSLTLALVIGAARAPATSFYEDASLITDPKQRAEISAALNALAKAPSDLPALEVALQTLPFVVDNLGTLAFYQFADPLKTQVCDLLLAPASVDVLALAGSKGSDLAATWACRKITVHAMNADSPLVQKAGGVIDAAAQARLKGPLLELLKRKDGTVRAAAVHALSPMFAAPDRPAFLKPLLKDQDVQVEAGALYQLFMMQCCDRDVEDAVAGFLEKDDPNLLVDCCWWWSARSRTNPALAAPQEAALIKLGGDPHAIVRRQVADAMGAYATPQHPDLANMLLRMADSDSDEIARANAVFALRNYRTPAVHEKLVEWSRQDQPDMVRQSAQSLLSEYNW